MKDIIKKIEALKCDEKKVHWFGRKLEWSARTYDEKCLVNAVITDILDIINDQKSYEMYRDHCEKCGQTMNFIHGKCQGCTPVEVKKIKNCKCDFCKAKGNNRHLLGLSNK